MSRRIKVCMKLDNSFCNDSRVTKEAQTLTQAGYEVAIVAMPGNGLKDEETKDGFRVVRLKKKNPLPLYDIVKELWQENADIYHAHDIDSLLPCFVVAKLRHKKLVYDSHEYWKGITYTRKSAKRNILIFLERYMVRGINLLITASHSYTRLIVSNYKLEKTSHITLLNVPKTYEKIKPKKLGKEVRLISIGSSQPGRGIEVMMETLKRLPKEYTLSFLGPNNHPGGLEQEAAKHGVSSRVKVLGSVAPMEVVKKASEYDISLVFIELVSESYQYTMPNKLFESIAAGLPVVASDMYEISRVVNKEKIGLVGDVASPDDMKLKILELVTKFEDARKNEAKIQPQYLWDKEAEKLVGAYREMEAINE